MMCVLGSKEPKPCWHRQEELYNSWDAEVHLHRRLFLGTVTLLSKLSCFDKKVFVLMFWGPGMCYQSSCSFSVIWRGDAHLSHSSLNPELSELIVLKLIWLSSGTFNIIISLHPQLPPCLLGRLNSQQRQPLHLTVRVS